MSHHRKESMKITDLLDRRSIALNAAPKTKEEALNQAVDLLAKSGKLNNVTEYRQQVYAREEESTTGVGEGIAIPHGKCSAVTRPGLAAMVIPEGVDYHSLDGRPVTLLFLIAAPNTADNVHLDVLSKLSVLLMDESFAHDLRHATNVSQFLEIIDRADSASRGIDERPEDDPADHSDIRNRENIDTAPDNPIRLLAVTSCPTGIAHTYMAAEGLERAAGTFGCSIKIETRGSGGARNVLTDADIAGASCIIVAADAQVPMERFQGRKVIECRVSEGINRADELIRRAMSGDAPVYNAVSPAAAEPEHSDKGSGIGHRIYTQLMNGVSHMLPFVVGGGILIAIAFLIDGLRVDINALPEGERGNFGSITAAAALCKEIGGVAFGLMLPVLAGYIAMAIGDRPALALGFVGGMIASGGKSGFLGALAVGFAAGYLILLLRRLCNLLPDALEKIAPVLIYPLFGILIIGLGMYYVIEPIMGALNELLYHGLDSMGNSSRILLGFVLGGMMSIDMGGPFNKAAYVFGTASIASGHYDIMASVMIGGMVPPLAIAAATMIFKSRFTAEERKAGPTNIIMGLGFITEGAIPYAAADPLRVLPSCILGAGFSGALSMLFHCTLMAPHGGIFVFPVVGHPIYYLISLLGGVIVSTLMLGLLKKRIL